MKIQTRLIVAFGTILAVVVIAFCIAFFSISNIRESAELVKGETVLFTRYAQEMRHDIIQIQQWLSDISATRALDGLDDGFAEAEKSRKAFLENAARFKKMFTRENKRKELRELEEIEKALDGYYKQGVLMAKAYIDGGPAEGNKIMDAFDKTAENLARKLNPFLEEQLAELDRNMLSIISSIKKLITGAILGFLLITAIIVAAVITISHSITRPISQAVDMIHEMEQGHLDNRLNLNRKDEIGVMTAAMDRFSDGLQNEMVAALRKLAAGDLTFEAIPRDERDDIRNALKKTSNDLNILIAQVIAATEQIAAGAGQVSEASQVLSQGATEQAASIEEITSSITEMTSQTKTNAENAAQANQLATEARNSATTGNNQMDEMVAAMGEINEAGKNISKIIKVIDEIAFQTNLLALNAAVEAARAGRHGKGFAVVAEEVRNLAARSAKAAKETAELIEGSVQKTEKGAAIANLTAESLSEIVNAVAKVTDLVGEIAAASNEQAQGISQINQGLGQIDQVTQQNTASAEQGASAAEELSSQALHLKNLVSTFKLKGAGHAAPKRRSLPKPKPAAHSVSPKQLPRKPAPTTPPPQKDTGWKKDIPEPEPEEPKVEQEKKQEVKPSDIIALDDTEFGKY